MTICAESQEELFEDELSDDTAEGKQSLQKSCESHARMIQMKVHKGTRVCRSHVKNLVKKRGENYCPQISQC